MRKSEFARPTGIRAIEILDPIAWQDRPIPERKWLVPGLIPMRSVTMLSGDGGLGKSILALQLIAACALGSPTQPRKWVGRPVMPCKAFGLFCEDEADELHRRMSDVVASQDSELGDLENAQLCSRVGLDNALMSWQSPWEPGEPTGLFAEVMNHCIESGAQLIVLDSLHDVFPGDEIKRTHARQFLNELRTIATETNGAVLLTAHPSLTGRNSGTGESGSTAWSNAARSRLYLLRSEGAREDERTLTTKKSNYAVAGGEIALRWRDGVLAALEDDTGMVGSIKRGNAEKTFLTCLDALRSEGREVSDKSRAGNYAAKIFAIRPEANGFDKRAFGLAMERLFSQKMIRVEIYGDRPSRRFERIVRTEQEALI